MLTKGLSYNLLQQNPELMAKDLTKLQANIQIARLLKAKEELKETRVEFH